MKLILIVILLLVLAGMLYFRFAPQDPQKVQQLPDNDLIGDQMGEPTGNTLLEGGFIHWRSVPKSDAQSVLERLDRIIRQTPRTHVLAGSVADGMITYVTRSFFWGFPDYTTVALTESDASHDRLTIYGRLRFGKSDFQVNKKRITGWLEALDAS